MINRRTFFRYTVLGATLIGTLRTMLALPDGRSYLEQAIRERLHYLNIPEDELGRFLSDYLLRLQKEVRFRSCLLGGFSFLLAPLRLFPGFARYDSLAEFYDSATECFLFSSDFFMHGADCSRPLRYLALYDPYRSACRNPFFNASVASRIDNAG